MIAIACQSNEDDFFFLSGFRDSLWKLCILPRGVGNVKHCGVNVDFILRQPHNWALNKQKAPVTEELLD